MRKALFSIIFCFISLYSLRGQTVPYTDPGFAAEGKALSRHEFVSYTVRAAAEAGNPDRADHYLPLEGKWRVLTSTVAEGGAAGFYRPRFSVAGWSQIDVPNVSLSAAAPPLAALAPPALPADVPLVQYRAEIDVPYLWLDRDVYLHIEGVGSSYALYVNDSRVGYSNDSRTPAEYLISPALTDGLNSIGIEVYGYSSGDWMETLIPAFVPGSLGRVYLYSQPKLCIRDFVVTARPDPTPGSKHAVVWVTAVMSNTYRSDEKITVGYDIYGPNGGKLLTYNLKETTVPGEGTDTIRLMEYIFGSVKKLWSPATPDLYTMMLYTRRDGRITEYIPFKFGLNTVEVRDGALWSNDKAIDVKAVNYNAARDAKTTEQELKKLKAHGLNTICVDYPQPRWFYELCDRVGFYVIDQANVNAGYRPEDRNVGGSLANDRAWLPAFIDRNAQMRGRSKNYTSLVAISMGGVCGNGYNLYKTYQWMKAHDSLHPVTYRDLQGQWNGDVTFPDAQDARSFLDKAPPKPAARRR